MYKNVLGFISKQSELSYFLHDFLNHIVLYIECKLLTSSYSRVNNKMLEQYVNQMASILSEFFFVDGEKKERFNILYYLLYYFRAYFGHTSKFDKCDVKGWAKSVVEERKNEIKKLWPKFI